MKYNSNLEPAEMSYFRLNLLSFLRDSHPDKANDLSFIAGRGDMAAEAYSEAIKSGLDHIQATEIANEALFKGLHFSPYSIIVEILWNEFYDDVSPSEAQTKAKELLPECQTVFAIYNLNDDYAETTEYQSLYTELVGTILILLENELQ
ncbi:MAG: DUF1896 family protein [Dysgonamonadaceae bacterium]|nr:DUF1896 family protein [Dysgonamonadaceae bacterium]